MTSTSRYDEFHPFLFAQHAKSPYLEFETFDKVISTKLPILFYFCCLVWGKILLFYIKSPSFLDLYFSAASQNCLPPKLDLLLIFLQDCGTNPLSLFHSGSGWVLFQDGKSEDWHESLAAGETGSEEIRKCQEGPRAETGGFAPSTGQHQQKFWTQLILNIMNTVVICKANDVSLFYNSWKCFLRVAGGG